MRMGLRAALRGIEAAGIAEYRDCGDPADAGQLGPALRRGRRFL